MKAKKFMEKTVHYWIGYFGIYDGLPDGAWFAAMEADLSNKKLLKECCDDLEIDMPSGCDGNDLVHEYLAARSGVEE